MHHSLKALIAGAALLTVAAPAGAVSFSLTIDGSADTDRPTFTLLNTSAAPLNPANYITSFELELGLPVLWQVDRLFAWDGAGNVTAPILRHVCVLPNGGSVPGDRNGQTGNTQGASGPLARIEFTGFNPGDTAKWRIDTDRAFSFIISPEVTDFRAALLGSTVRVGFANGLTARANLGPTFFNFFGDRRVVSVAAAIPEPSSWALMITGFGLTGLALRRRGRPRLAA